MSKETEIEDAELGWSETVIMVCTKCGKQFNKTNQEAPEKIKSELKSIAKDKLGKKSVRVVTSSCLNICPAGKIAIAVASIKDPGVFKAYKVDPEVSADELFKIILDV